MFCENCGKIIDDSSTFCLHCGTQQTSTNSSYTNVNYSNTNYTNTGYSIAGYTNNMINNSNYDIDEVVRNHHPIYINTPQNRAYLDNALNRVIPTYNGTEDLSWAMSNCNMTFIENNINQADTDTLVTSLKGLNYYINMCSDKRIVTEVREIVVSTLKHRDLSMYNQTAQIPGTANKKHKKKASPAKVILGTLLLFFGIPIAVAVFAPMIFGSKINPDYTKGEVEDNVYINEWSDIRLEIPDGWEEASDEAYISYLKSIGSKVDKQDDYGLIISDKSHQHEINIYYDYIYNPSKEYTVDEYITESITLSQEQLDSYGISYNFNNIPDTSISGHNYSGFILSISELNSTMYQYVRIKDDYAINIIIDIPAGDDVDDYINLFESYD